MHISFRLFLCILTVSYFSEYNWPTRLTYFFSFYCLYQISTCSGLLGWYIYSFQLSDLKNVLYNGIYTYWKCNTVCPNMDWLKSSKTMMWPFHSWNGIRNIYLFFCYQKLVEKFSCYITFFWFIGYKLQKYTSLMKNWISNIKATPELVYFPVNPSWT